MWRELVERYAFCARELSEAVAELGKQIHLGPVQSRELLEDIRTKHERCNAAAEEIEDYLNQKADAGKCG